MRNTWSVKPRLLPARPTEACRTSKITVLCIGTCALSSARTIPLYLTSISVDVPLAFRLTPDHSINCAVHIIIFRTSNQRLSFTALFLSPLNISCWLNTFQIASNICLSIFCLCSSYVCNAVVSSSRPSTMCTPNYRLTHSTPRALAYNAVD